MTRMSVAAGICGPGLFVTAMAMSGSRPAAREAVDPEVLVAREAAWRPTLEAT